MINTFELKFPLYKLMPKNRAPGESIDLTGMLDLTTGETLGLLFSTEENAIRYTYLLGLDESIVEISSLSSLVFLCRSVLKAEAIEDLVLDYGHILDEEVHSFRVKDIADIPIQEDSRFDDA